MLTVNSAVIHKLEKEQHGAASTNNRNSLLVLTDTVKKLVQDIHALYTKKPNKGYGRFESDTTNYPSSSILHTHYVTEETSFLELSISLMSVLEAKATSVSLATGGFVLMADVINEQSIRFFIVAIINNIKGNAINENTLEIIESAHIDLDNLRVAGRVNISEWQNEQTDTRYVGFLKNKGEVANYFKLFLGCNELIENYDESRNLVTFIRTYAKNVFQNAESQNDFIQRAFNDLNEKAKSRTSLSLESFANTMSPDDPDHFLNALSTSGIELCDGFIPHSKAIKTLTKIKCKTNYWAIDIERQAFVNGFATYDRECGELILRNLPAELLADLDSEFDDAN